MAIDFRIRDFGRPLSILRLKRLFDQSQWWSPDAQWAYQAERFRQVFKHAYRTVPYYRELFDHSGIHPEQILRPQDLERLPVLTRDTLQENPLRLCSGWKGSHSNHWLASSGTSGRRVSVRMDQHANVLEFVYYWRWWGWAGYRLGDRFAEFSSRYFLRQPAINRPERVLERLTGRLLLNSLALTPSLSEKHAIALRKYRPKFLKGSPSVLNHFASFLEQAGISDIRFKALFTTGETLLPFQRKRLEQLFGCKVYDSYGHTERTVAISQCPAGSYHLHSDYGIAEMLPTTAAVSGLRTVRLIGTSLHNLSMPLLRYDTGDRVIVQERPPQCPCKRVLPVIEQILGRRQDVVIRPDGGIVTGLFLALDEMPDVSMGQFIQTARDKLLAKVVPQPGFSSESARQITASLRRFLGDEMQIDIETASAQSLQPAAGEKFRGVVSRLP